MFSFQKLSIAARGLFQISKCNNYASKSIFVANVNKNVTDEALRAHFEKIAPIEGVRLPKNRFNNQGRGFGFVQLDETHIDKVMELDGSELQGQPIRLEICKTERIQPYKGM